METATSAKPKDATLSRAERHWELYKCAFTGLHAQFTHSIWADLDGNAHLSCADVGEKPERSKLLARIAWNSATAACDLFEKEETIETFNDTLKQ
jgi:hypothetical protein